MITKAGDKGKREDRRVTDGERKKKVKKKNNNNKQGCRKKHEIERGEGKEGSDGWKK